MNRSDLVEQLAREGFTDPRRALDVVLNTISAALRAGDQVMVTEFGRWEPRPHAERLSHNPRTGEVVYTPPKVAAGFKPSPVLTARLNRAADDIPHFFSVSPLLP